jgi:hypothetical protein
VSHVVLERRHEKAGDVFEDDLELAGIVDAQPRSDGQAEDQDNQADERGESDVVRDVDVQRRQ